ncbi:MAG: hypothetical protein IH802_12430, partial [Nitrospinae bacterium]|nr:hypothetical protein [Nitrospinota bacterium]
LVSVAVAAIGAGLAGFASLVVFIVFLFLRRLSGGLGAARGHHQIYAETFAVWLMLFLGLQLLAEVVAPLRVASSLACWSAASCSRRNEAKRRSPSISRSNRRNSIPQRPSISSRAEAVSRVKEMVEGGHLTFLIRKHLKPNEKLI